MNAAVAVYALLFAPPDVLPSEWPDDYRAYVAAYRESYLAAEQDKLKAVQKEALQNRGGVGYKERLRTIKKRISDLKRAGYVLEPVLFGEDPFRGRKGFEKGEMGRISANNATYRIDQVIDEQTALITPVLLRTELAVRGNPAIEFGQPIPTRKRQVDGTTFMLRGVDTSEWTDDNHIQKLPGAYRCVGNETYETAVGSQRTVFLVEPIQPKDKEKVEDQD